jgi:hypothetical protein
MSSVVISGDTSGSVTLQAPAVAGSTTLTLPATSGTILQSGTVVTEAQGGNGTTTGYYGFKNRIINGAMVIDQRNAGASATNLAASGVYGLDRWKYYGTSASKFTIQQNAGSVTPPVGFANYLGITSLSANTPAATDEYIFIQNIEGYNIADLAWGTASAKSITISFQVYSSLTGTFSGALGNSANTRIYPFTYTISSANTWTTASITIAGDTSGTWLTTNGVGIRVNFNLGTGSTYLGTAGSWSGTFANGATGSVNVLGTNGATFYITGVQLEKGSTATSFDYRPYSAELQLCQRYFLKNSNDGSTGTFLVGVVNTSTSADRCGMAFPVTMRSPPSATVGGSSNPRIYDAGATPAITSIGSNASSSFGACLGLTASAGALTVGRAAIIIENGTSFITYSAEL